MELDYQKKYYNLEDFNEANKEFEEFLSRCTYIDIEKIPQNKFTVSTMTITTKFSDNEVNIKMIYQRLLLDDEIKYIENGKNVRGEKIKKKKTYNIQKKERKSNDKRKLNKGNPFSNQISIGFLCNIKNHIHNKPICVKIFKNGRIQMTGCKSLEEVKITYNKLYKKINNIKIEYYLDTKKINIYAVKDIKKLEDIKINTEMANGTFSTNYKINLSKLYVKLIEIYNDEEIFINRDKKTQIVCYLKKFKYFNEKKKKEKIPSVFIYNSGSINIIAINLEILMNSYKLISNFMDKYYKELIEVEIKYADIINQL
jgi:hypothetical protein